jgi:dTDP-4-dehydrorhamnose reductase
MKVLITGAAGMLGSAVFPAFVRAGHDVRATDLAPRPEAGLPMTTLDVRDLAVVRAEIESFEPDLVAHLAAETDLETCERDPDHAYLTNTIGTQHVAAITGRQGATLVYISTAGVFDGEKTTGPYTEFDEPRPINVYGASKFQGERIAASLNPRSYVVRAGWMVGGGERDHKFVAKVLEQIANGATVIHAVDDKLGTPTYTEDFAVNLLRLIEEPRYGLYHMTCRGDGSRLEVAREIVAWLGRDVEVVPVSSSHFATTYFAPRPRSEMMRNYMLELAGIDLMRPWPEALREYLDRSVGGQVGGPGRNGT